MTTSPTPPDPSSGREPDCEWCGAPLIREDGVWVDHIFGSGEYCPEGEAVGHSGTSPHNPACRAPDPSSGREPATEAGRSFRGACGYDHAERIFAIEQEAAAIERRRVVRDLKNELPVRPSGPSQSNIDLHAIYEVIDAILDDLASPTPEPRTVLIDDIISRLGGLPCDGHEDFAAGTFLFHRERECPE